MKLIDAHAHLQFPQFEMDREAVIARARAAAVGVINVGTDLETSRTAIELAETYPDMMWATVGIHPTDLPPPDQTDKVFAELEKLARHPKVVGIGECGLEIRSEKLEVGSWHRQIEIFGRQVELAKMVGKPLMVHCRNAYNELLQLLTSNFSLPNFNIHFFAGDWPTARGFLDLGGTLSFTGVITFTNQYDEVIKNLPLDRLLVETDCPFVAPAPYRGKRNEPIYVEEVIKRVVALRDLSAEAVAAATLANTRRFASLSTLC